MPYVSHRGQQIHYSVEGSGPLVVLQHGFFTDARAWKQAGFVTALRDRYRVAQVDSLGHGLSDKPGEAELYSQRQRAGDIVAVIDDLGAERAHVLGYSMGGWMAVGVAKYHADRLASLTVGGWDLFESAGAERATSVAFQEIIDGARAVAPEYYAWVTPAVEPGLRACWEALSDRAGAEAAVIEAGCPVMLWSGRDDPFHGPMQSFAVAHQLTFLSTPGDHNGAVMLHGTESAEGFMAFLKQQRPTSRPTALNREKRKSG